MDLGEPEAPDAIFARVPRQLAVDDIIGFDSRSRGPLLVLVGWEVTSNRAAAPMRSARSGVT